MGNPKEELIIPTSKTQTEVNRNYCINKIINDPSRII
jgi:hypothetical protein